MKTISLNDLLDRLRSPTPPALVEALPSRHFMQGHLPGALNINVGEVKALAPELLPTKAAGVVVYCASASCTNSDQVAVQLHALGYTDVAVFKGARPNGMRPVMRWKRVPHYRPRRRRRVRDRSSISQPDVLIRISWRISQQCRAAHWHKPR